MKRKGTFAKRSAKKSRTGNQLLPTVVNAIAHDEALPGNLRALLKSVLPIVLSANKADRHAFEAEVVDQARAALGAVQHAMEEKHAGAMAHQREVTAPGEKAKRTSATKDAGAHLEAVKAKLETDKATKKTCEKSVEEAADAVKAAEKEEKVADKELQRHINKRDNLSNALGHEFNGLKDGTLAGADVKKAVNKLLSIGKDFGLDSTLLQTLPHACKTPLAARTEFQTMMFANMQKLIEHQIEVCSHTVAEAEPVKAAKAAVVAGAKDALAHAEAALKAAADELTATQNANKEAHKAVSHADAHRRKIWEDMRHACDSQDDLADKVKNLKEHVWEAFNQLKEKEPEPEPVEEPAAEAEAETVPAEEPTHAE